MALDKSKYIIYKIKLKKNSFLTIFKFSPSYSGFSKVIKIIDFPILLITYLLFFLRFRSINLLFKLIKDNLVSDFVEKNIVDHELDILKNFEEFPTKELHDYLLTNKRDINSAIKLGNISHTRWFVKYMEHLHNNKLIEKYTKSSQFVAFIGIVPFPCLPIFKNSKIFERINFLISSLPIFVLDIIAFIIFAIKINKSIVFNYKDSNKIRIYNIKKNNQNINLNVVNVSIYFYRELEPLLEIIKSLPDNYEFNIISLNRVKNISSFFQKQGLFTSHKDIEFENLNYHSKLIRNIILVILHPIYILKKNKYWNNSLFYAFIYNIFSIRTITRLSIVESFIKNNFVNFKFLSFNCWELPYLFYYKFPKTFTIGKYSLVPGTFYSLYFRPHDKILTVNKSQYKKLSYLHKGKVTLLGKKKNYKNSENLKILQNSFDLNSLEYMVWIGTKRCQGISDLMLLNSLKKTIKICNHFGLKLFIRSHPTISKKDVDNLYGQILNQKFIFDNNSSLEDIASLKGIFSLTTSTADLVVFEKFKPVICLGFDQVVNSRYGIPYKYILGNLCTESEDEAIKALESLNNNSKKIESLNRRIKNYLGEINFLNQNFDSDLINVFNYDLK